MPPAPRHACLPFLRGHVEPTLSQPAWESGPSDEAPFGLWGQRQLPGVPLSVETVPDRLITRVAGSIATFLLGLHRFPVKQAQGLAVPGPRAWRQHLDEAGREGLPPLRGELSFSEFGRLRRWWRNFTADDRNWSDEPTLVHGDLRPGDLLVDPEQTELIAVDGFQSAALGDPAIDFAGLVRCTRRRVQLARRRCLPARRRAHRRGRAAARAAVGYRCLGPRSGARRTQRRRGGAGNDRRGTPRRARAKRAAAGTALGLS